jgi:hypothetical protein
MRMNRKECIDDLNYIKKALTEGTLTRYDAIVFLIDTLTEYLKGDKPLEQWQKEFHEVVESLDVEKFKTFYRMYQDNVYGGRPMPKSDKVIMASMCKVALEITTISEATKKKADEWLEANNFTKGIWR